MSTDKTMALANNALAPSLKLQIGDFLPTKGAWQVTRLASRAAYRETLRPVPPILRPAWDQQRALHHLCNVELPGLAPATLADCMRHGDHTAYKQADKLRLTRVDRVSYGRPESRHETASTIGAVANAIHDEWKAFDASNFDTMEANAM